MLAAFAFALSMLWDAVRPGYTHAVVDRLPSPDGRWVAVIDEYISDVGLLAMTAVTAEVHLVSTSSPIRDIEIFGIGTGGNVSERPRLAWSAPNVLRVTVPLYDYLRLQPRQVEGILVDVRFDPDDPMVRTVCRDIPAQMK